MITIKATGDTTLYTAGKYCEEDILVQVPEGGADLPELTNEGTSADLLLGKELIDSNGNVVTGTIPTKTQSDLTVNGAIVSIPSGYYASSATKSVSTATQATPSITVDSSTGLITTTATQTTGYVVGGTKTDTEQLTTQTAKTITPNRNSQIAIEKNVYTIGTVTVEAIPEEFQDVSSVTAGAEDVFVGKKIVSSTGEVVDGTFTIENELTTQDDLITQIQTALQNKASAEPVLQDKTVTPTESSQTVVPDSGYDGLSAVTVNPIPSEYIMPSGTKEITSNGTHDVTEYASVSVSVASGGGDEDLEAVLTEQEASIEELKEILQSKASSGAELNLGTCTVIINVPSKTNYYICRESVSDGAITYNMSKSYTDAPITITSRCDSVMYIVAGTIDGVEVTDGEILRVVSGQGVTYKTPSLNNSIVQITLTA